MVFMGKVISGVKNQHFDYASLIMTAGTFTFLFDMAFIILYQSLSLIHIFRRVLMYEAGSALSAAWYIPGRRYNAVCS